MLFSGSITVVYEGCGFMAFMRIANVDPKDYDSVDDIVLFGFMIMSMFNLFKFIFGFGKCRYCFDFGQNSIDSAK
jgi:hypothetical protein